MGNVMIHEPHMRSSTRARIRDSMADAISSASTLRAGLARSRVA